jgi:hypothetical protein
MPRAPAKIRKRFIDGHTVVLDWELEETLVYGVPVIFGPPCRLQTADEWRREWNQWGSTILPKSLEHRPGTRPVAMYAAGEIEPRRLRMPLPVGHGFWRVDVRHRDGRTVTHWLNVPMPYMLPEVQHLKRLGIVDADEARRHREWVTRPNDECDTCAVNSYPLEMSLYQ